MRVRNKNIDGAQKQSLVIFLPQLLTHFKNSLILIVVFADIILCYNKTVNNSSNYFATNHHFHNKDNLFSNDSILAIRPFLVNSSNVSILRTKRQWNAIALPQLAMSFNRPPLGNIYGAAPAYSNSAEYCPSACLPCSYNQCRAYQVQCVPSVVNCCCPSTSNAPVTPISPLYKYDLSGKLLVSKIVTF